MTKSSEKIKQTCTVCGRELMYDAIKVSTDAEFEEELSFVNQVYRIETDNSNGSKKCIKNRAVGICSKIDCSQPHVMIVKPS